MRPYLALTFGLIIFSWLNIGAQDMESSFLLRKAEIVQNLTLLENPGSLIPLRRLDTLQIASVSVGTGTVTPFQRMLEKYATIRHFTLNMHATPEQQAQLLRSMSAYNLVILGIHHPHASNSNLFMNLKGKVVTVFFTPISNTVVVPDMFSGSLLFAGHNDELTQEMAAQAVFGGLPISGRLPQIFGKYETGQGIQIPHAVRLGYTIPEETGINSASLTFTIDSIINDAIRQQAFPGCNILIAKEGKVIFHKTYGYHTYENIIPASPNDIYDLASVTKVTSALPAIMKLTEEGKIGLDDPFSDYWPDWQKRFLHRSNKDDLTFRELLAHQAGLVPFIKFYENTQKQGKAQSRWFRVEADEKYNLMVAPGMYLRNNFRKKVYKTIRLSELKDRGRYIYSDLFFIMAPEVISRVSGDDYLHYLDSCFYRPLGAGTLTYLPVRKFSTDRIVPTEADQYFRKRLLQGSVHDEASAVLGGISGNAGLFGSANDLAKILQMYLWNGTYGGEQYLKEATLKEFNRVQYPHNGNRRALGFDKPLPNNSTLSLKDSYPSPDVSTESFGHSGYTGTFFWIDPKYQLVYIMLANRVYPNRSYTKLTELSIRTKVQQAIYDEILKR
ncbi:MAG: serine hydrolase [Bacteroidales bacterium]|nr:serine hydrolase [Bacteroidales bacterium]